MSEHGTLTDLVGDIYDTTLNSALWTHVIAKITDFVGGQAGGLFLKDPESKLGNVEYHYNGDPHYVQLYTKTYSKIGPMAVLPPAGQIVSIPDLMSYDEYRRGRYYHEWMRPQGWIDCANVVLERTGSNRAVILGISPSKPTGMVDEAMRQRMTLVIPHLRRALLIGKAMDFKQAQQAAFAETLDNLTVGIFFVDASGQIIEANNVGQDMLYANDFLGSTGGRLTAHDAGLDRTIRQAFTACANGDAEIGVKAIAVPLAAQDGERYMAHALPLTSGLRRDIGTAYGATAAIFVRKIALETPSIPEIRPRNLQADSDRATRARAHNPAWWRIRDSPGARHRRDYGQNAPAENFRKAGREPPNRSCQACCKIRRSAFIAHASERKSVRLRKASNKEAKHRF